MTDTPTQAAARGELHQVASGMCHPDDCKRWLELNYNLLYAVLTAAAEVGDKRDEIIAGLQHHVRRLTKLLDDQLGTPCEQIRHAQEIEATIERCAQVADATGGNGYAIAAAIRALKDKP